MTTSDSIYGGGNRGTIAAAFTDREAARSALTELHDAGFRNVWLGVTHGDATTGAGTTVVSETAGGVMDSIGRFFSGEGTQEQALHQALVARGLGDAQARRLEATLPAGSAIVTVDGENDATEAIEILQDCGGDVDVSYGQSTTSGTSVTAARPVDVDDARRLQLREERLSIDKQRVSSGEARIGKEVVSQRQSVDVPVFHEELFIQRRPVSEGASASATPIGDGEEIRIPLTQERVDVSKRTVVTEEVAIGKRTVQGTEHVSDTVRHEELRVDDAGTTLNDDPLLPRS
jgi:uncharacterized protein (TIGR02271 family)